MAAALADALPARLRATVEGAAGGAGWGGRGARGVLRAAVLAAFEETDAALLEVGWDGKRDRGRERERERERERQRERESMEQKIRGEKRARQRIWIREL